MSLPKKALAALAVVFAIATWIAPMIWLHFNPAKPPPAGCISMTPQELKAGLSDDICPYGFKSGE